MHIIICTHGRFILTTRWDKKGFESRDSRGNQTFEPDVSNFASPISNFAFRITLFDRTSENETALLSPPSHQFTELDEQDRDGQCS